MAIYTVAPKTLADGEQPRLVRAANQARALKHVARDFTVAVPSPDELHRLGKAGVEVEDAEADDDSGEAA